MLDFLKSYGELIASGILFVMAVITLIVKRRPKTVDDFVQMIALVVEQLPTMIDSVERPGDGVLKKDEVLNAALKLAYKILGRNLTDNEINTVRKKVGDQIEAILSTPHKKEED